MDNKNYPINQPSGARDLKPNPQAPTPPPNPKSVPDLVPLDGGKPGAAVPRPNQDQVIPSSNRNNLNAFNYPEDSLMKDTEGLPPAGSGSPAKKIVLIIILLLIIGGGVFYFFFFPGKYTVMVMGKRIQKLNTFGYSGQIDLEIQSDKSLPLLTYIDPGRAVLGTNTQGLIPSGQESNKAGIVIKFNGKADASDTKKPKMMYNIDNLQLTDNKKTLDLISLETRFIDNIIYLKINDISKEIIDASSFKNIWYSYDAKEYTASNANNDNNLSKEDQTKLRDLPMKYPFIKIIGLPKNDKIFSQTFHYAYELDKTNLTNMMVEAAKIENKKFTEKNAELMRKDLEEALKSINMNGELWIGKFDFYPHKITCKVTSTDSEYGYTGSFDLGLEMENFNKAQQIDVPQGAKKFEELINTISAQYMAKYDQAQEQSSIDSDQDGLSDAEESYFGTNPYKSDTDGDGYSDLNEINGGFNPLGPGR